MAKQKEHQLVTEIKKEIKSAIAQFGSYEYLDKGPDEVMDTNQLLEKYNALTEGEQKQVRTQLNKTEQGQTFVSYIFGDEEDNEPTGPVKRIKMERFNGLF